MKKNVQKKLITLIVLVLAVVAVVEFEKITKGRAEPCVDGHCRLPAEKAGAIIGPQSVPLLLSPSETQQQPLPQLIDFGAGKCTTCKTMNIVLEELQKEYVNQLTVQFVDVWENKEAGEAYSIRMIPTQIFLDAKGNELFRHEGFISKEDILKKWNELGVPLKPNHIQTT